MSQYSTGLELILNATEGVLQIIVTDDEQPLCVQEWHRADRATEILAPALAEICRTLDVSLAKFRRIACVRGPGSFTGIRLVLATAAALRRTGAARLAGLDYMQALATSAVLRRGLAYGAQIWVLTHARRNLVHCQPFLSYGPQIPAQPLSAVDLCSPLEALRRVVEDSGALLPAGIEAQPPLWVCGSGLARNAAVFDEFSGMRQMPLAGNTPVVTLPKLVSPDSAALRLLARHGDYFDEDIEPLYVRPCDAVENLPQLAPKLGMSGENAAAALDAMLERTPQSEI
jgi:tRNA threonylcarbamoyladenosine biosynthesis protein TsaB